MIYKILFGGDLHRKHKDVSTIKGYVKCCDYNYDKLIEIVLNEGITHFISLGDWYDRGYGEDISAALADTSKDEYFARILKGNFYGVIGNHIRLSMDSNPELYLIQPHQTIKSRKKVKRTEQIIKTPHTLMIGGLQISLVHHQMGSMNVNDYSVHRNPNAKYHIAVVHDEKFIPNSMMLKASLPPSKSLDNDIARVLSGVDLCISGHIHTPLGMFDISPTTKMVVPGSLSNTSISMNSRHSTCKLPLITVNDETDEISFSYINFDLNIGMVTFAEKALENVSDKLKTIRGNNLKELYGDKPVESIFSSGISSLSFGDFLRQQNYTESDKNLILSTIKNPNQVYDLVKIHNDWSESDSK